MILINSKDEDYSTNMVCKWLLNFQKTFLRLGEDNVIKGLDILINNKGEHVSLFTENIQFNFSDIESYWLRKGKLKLNSKFTFTLREDEEFLASNSLFRYLMHEETQSLIDFMNYKLKQRPHLGNENLGEGNKLISFVIARECGLRIPQSFISTSKKNLYDYYEKNDKLIVKPIEDGYGTHENQLDVSTRYVIANEKTFENVSEYVFPSCMQEYIEKKIEIRVFYLKGELFSMAIFSQIDPKTKIDFRNYNDDKPNRMVPYNLPNSIALKIKLFMQRIELNSGSLDLILTRDNEYVFLEVNPAGQYGMVDFACNYGLDKRIAQFLAYEN